MNLSIPNDSRDFYVPICRWDRVSATLLTRDIAVHSFRTVTRLDALTELRLLPNDERCAWRALVFTVFACQREGEGSRASRKSGVQISNAHISKMVRVSNGNLSFMVYAKLTKSTMLCDWNRFQSSRTTYKGDSGLWPWFGPCTRGKGWKW